MAQQNNDFITKDAYLIIVSGMEKDSLSIQQYDKTKANKDRNLLDTKLKNTIANVAIAGITSPIIQNAVSKKISNPTLGRINSSIFDIMADGKIYNQEVAEDFIGSCTNQLDNMFTDLGYPTPSALYSAIKPNGAGISKDLAPKFLNLFGKQSNQEIKEINNKKQKTKNVMIVKLKLVTADEEDLPISIPTRKTENNFNIATSINNENATRSFVAKIVHNDNKKINMYDIKNQLKFIRETKKYVDVYVCDNDVSEVEVLKNHLLSNLSFNIEDKNSIECNISFTKVPKWNVIIDTTLDKSLGGTGDNGRSTSNKRKSTTNSNIKNKIKIQGQPKNFTVGNQTGYDITTTWLNNYKQAISSGDTALAQNYLSRLTERLLANSANQGYRFTEDMVRKIIQDGGIVIKV